MIYGLEIDLILMEHHETDKKCYFEAKNHEMHEKAKMLIFRNINNILKTIKL